MRRALPASLLALTFVLSSCGGSESRESDGRGLGGNNEGTETTLGGATKGNSDESTFRFDDPCTLLTDDEVEAAIGKVAKGTRAAPRMDELGEAVVGCTWGAIASEDPAIAVQASRPGEGGVDYLQTLTGAAARSSDPIHVGTNGKLLGTAFVPGGGGVGQSVQFEIGGGTIVVGLLRGEQADLERAAEAVAEKVG